MPPITVPPDIEDRIAEIIADLDEFGETFQELIDDLRGLLDAF
jgi:hypothetical protein